MKAWPLLAPLALARTTSLAQSAKVQLEVPPCTGSMEKGAPARALFGRSGSGEKRCPHGANAENINRHWERTV